MEAMYVIKETLKSKSGLFFDKLGSLFQIKLSIHGSTSNFYERVKKPQQCSVTTVGFCHIEGLNLNLTLFLDFDVQRKTIQCCLSVFSTMSEFSWNAVRRYS